MGILGARRTWVTVHLYLGLFAGALLALTGLTGAVLVFSDEIDRAFNPQLAAVAMDAPAATPEAVVQAVQARTGRRPYMLELPTASRPQYLAFVNEGEDAPLRAVSVDRVSAEVLADRRWGSFFVSFIRQLHTELLLGDPGHYVLAAIGVLGLVSVITGLYLWWPRASGWRRVLAFRWSRHPTALNYELHRISGFYLLVLSLVVLLSGTYLAMPQPFTSLAGTFAQVTPYPDAVPSATPLPGTQPITVSQAAQVVQRYRPAAVVTGIYLPVQSHESYAVYYRGADEPPSEFGRSALWIDQYDARVLQAHEYTASSAADRFFALQILLHNGEIAGAAGPWLVLATGLALPLLFGTGVYLWWVRRRPQRRAAMANPA